MEINGINIEPGKQERLAVNIAKLPSRHDIDLNIMVARAKEEGPVLLLMGGVHGDEINGVEIVRRMIERDLHIPTRGTVIAIPVLNIYGFVHFSRYVPDGKDVNRSFPGSKSGSLASRVAHYFTKDILPLINYGLDFHTGGAERVNYPQVRCSFKDEKALKLAETFGAPFILNSKYRKGSLRSTAARRNKSFLVYEAGESIRLDEFAIEEGIKGAQRVMYELGMQEEKPAPSQESIKLNSSGWLRASHSGIFKAEVKSGDYIKRNQLIGIISDPFDQFRKRVKARKSGYVIGLNNHPVVHQGDALLHIGYP